MSVEQRMEEATQFAGKCHTCRGSIPITKDDFLEVADKAPDLDAQFEALKEIAARGAMTKCGGCSVHAGGTYDKNTLVGRIVCTHKAINSVPV